MFLPKYSDRSSSSAEEDSLRGAEGRASELNYHSSQPHKLASEKVNFASIGQKQTIF